MDPILLTNEESKDLVSHHRTQIFRPAVSEGQLSDFGYHAIGKDCEALTSLVDDPVPVTLQIMIWNFPEAPTFLSGWTVVVEMRPPSPKLLVDIMLAAGDDEITAVSALYIWSIDRDWIRTNGAEMLTEFRARGMSQPITVLLAPLSITVLTKSLFPEERTRLFEAVKAELVRREVDDLHGLLTGLEP